ncbi:MAG: flagellar basal-body rod protein FlgG [Hyphomicrobiaceae bacterium]|nr:flagellar basal-body rod protein FlgG [Hyphomicrobiaceae bacterium]MCC0024796.1 flagellar basal-body rod protein FlgG [Hyphomicrobiaceae bacterium]
MQALYTAASGMAAQERNVEVLSNNIANMRTTGFKRQRIEFQDLLYQIYRRAGSLTSDGGTQVPVGVEVGSGVKTAATSRIMSQGSVEVTNKDLDVAIRGEGYFIVNLPDGRTAYTRDGSFERNSSGELVTIDGYEVQPGIVIPDTARSVSISDDGVVEAFLNNDSTPTQLGQLQLARFVNKHGLEAMGENLFLETDASGTAQVGSPNADSFGSVLQGYLELSNVNAVTEIADLIAAQRAYEMNSRVISGADEMMRSATQIA